MSQSTGQSIDTELRAGDHVCCLYSSNGPARDDVIVGYVEDGLRAGNRCVCFVDDAAVIGAQIPQDLIQHPGDLTFSNPDDAYLPEGEFSKEAHLSRLELLATSTLAAGYGHLRLLGDASFVAKREVDTKTWFAYEAAVNNFAPRYPQYLMCLYDLDRFDGDFIMCVLRTHPRILLNGMVIQNPYYIPPNELLGTL